jgi:hypothetical protein
MRTIGRVLVVGDGSKTGSGIILTCDGSGTGWNMQPDMTQSRWSATATLLKDGKVLVVGGARAPTPPSTPTRPSSSCPDPCLPTRAS